MSTSAKTVHLRPPVHAALKGLALSRGNTIRDETHEAVTAYLAHWRIPIRPEPPHGQRTLVEAFEEAAGEGVSEATGQTWVWQQVDP